MASSSARSFILCLASAVMAMLAFERAEGAGRLQLKLISYANPTGTGDNGHCCDGRSIFCESNGGCDTYFKICVDTYSGSENMSSCSLGLITTGTWSNQHSITFSAMLHDKPNPIELPFSTWERGAFIKVQVWDNDQGSNKDDQIDFLKSRVSIVPSRTAYRAEYIPLRLESRTTMLAEVRAFCDVDWYGTDCSVRCAAQNGPAGHYDCGSAGQKICHAGWTGSSCTIEVDECESSPCQHGVCVDAVASYACRCLNGYTGTDCSIDVDDCASVTCQGDRSSCVDLVNGYRCDCPPDRTGVHCESPFDPCSSAPCLNNGTCLSGVRGLKESYECACAEGWKGGRCETEAKGCDSSPCARGSSCVEEPLGGYRCLCRDGWSGVNCSIDPCASNPCFNYATCVILEFSPPAITHTLASITPSTALDDSRLRHDAESFEDSEEAEEEYSPSVVEATTYSSSQSGSEAGSHMTTDLFECRCTAQFQGKFCDQIVRNGKGGGSSGVNLNDGADDDENAWKMNDGEINTFVFANRLSESELNHLTSSMVHLVSCYLANSDVHARSDQAGSELAGLAIPVSDHLKGSELVGLELAFPDQTSIGLAGSNSTGSEAAGSDSAGPKHAGSDLAGSDPVLNGSAGQSAAVGPCPGGGWADTRTVRVDFDVKACHTGDRRELTAYVYRVTVLDREEVLSREIVGEMLSGLSATEREALLPQTPLSISADVCEGAHAGAHAMREPGRQTHLYWVLGAIAGVTLCALAAVVYVAVRCRKRKVITREILVPAHSNPLYTPSSAPLEPFLSSSQSLAEDAHELQPFLPAPLPDHTTADPGRSAEGSPPVQFSDWCSAESRDGATRSSQTLGVAAVRGQSMVSENVTSGEVV